MRNRRRALAGAALCLALAFSPRSAFSQALPEAGLRAGFVKATGKRLGAFSAPTLAGTTLDRSALSGKPALFHVWSLASDPGGEGLARIAALRAAVPDALIVALSLDKPARVEGLVASAGLDPALVAAEAKGAILALGGPPAPSWVFVSPEGDIAAYRLGRLEPAQAADGVKALFAAYAPRTTSSAAAAPVAPQASPPDASQSASSDASMEASILVELNLARTQPKAFADVLREYRKLIRGTYLERPGEITVVLNEGVRAVDEAIAFLERQKPLAPLALSKGLSLAAGDHARDQGKSGKTGHTGSDRSTMDTRIGRYGAWQRTAGENIAYGADTPRDVVIQLIVDDGVPSRGHRANIFNPGFLVVGIAFGKHPAYGTICVQDFAGGFVEK